MVCDFFYCNMNSFTHFARGGSYEQLTDNLYEYLPECNSRLAVHTSYLSYNIGFAPLEPVPRPSQLRRSLKP